MKKIVSILWLSCIALTFNIHAQTQATSSNFTRLDRIVVVVNREVITQSQLNKEIEHIKKQYEQSNQPLPSVNELRSKVLDSLIAKSLTLQLATSKGVIATDEDVDKAINNILKLNKIDLVQLKQALQQQGISYDTYKKQLQEQIVMQKVQQEEVAKTITLTPEDVKKFANENKNKFNGYNAYHVVDILMPISESSTPEQVASLRKQANEVVALLQKGKAIDEILKQYPYAQNNDLGWRSVGELPSIFQAKVANMTVKSVSTPIQAPNGFHILQLLEAKGENPKLTENDLKNLAFQQKVNEGIKVWIDKLRSESYVKIMN